MSRAGAINEVSELGRSVPPRFSGRLRRRCSSSLEKSESYARLHVGMGISPLHQWWTGYRLLWPDQGDERAGDRDPVRTAEAGDLTVLDAREAAEPARGFAVGVAGHGISAG